MPSSTHSLLFWSCLQVLNRERYEALMKVFGDLDAASRHIDAELLRGLGCREETVHNALKRMEKCDLESEIQLLNSMNAHVIDLQDSRYSLHLFNVSDPPPFLYAQGDLSLLKEPSVGLVGTRKMSSYGKRVTTEFTRALAQAKIVTVSGLARGVDSLVAEETIAAGGKTVAVLGQGLLTLSPQSRMLADRIVAAGGLVLSEFPLRMAPDLFTFPLRNRIIAGLSLATVVLEAPESSGALITAKLAFDYGRDVFAIPGQIYDANYAGCHAIIRKNQARLAASPRDVLTELGVVLSDEDPGRVPYEPQNDDERVVMNLLTGMPQLVDDLADRSLLPIGAIGSTLTVLELNGAAKNLGGGQWVKA